MLPCELHFLQQLKGLGYKVRIKFSNWYLQNIRANVLCLNLVLHSDECTFTTTAKLVRTMPGFVKWKTLGNKEKSLGIVKTYLCGARYLRIK